MLSSGLIALDDACYMPVSGGLRSAARADGLLHRKRLYDMSRVEAHSFRANSLDVDRHVGSGRLSMLQIFYQDSYGLSDPQGVRNRYANNYSDY